MEIIYRYILITISLIVALQLSAQDTLILKEVKAITSLQVDMEGNFFVADNDFSLLKYSIEGKLITNVNIKSYGSITSIDCSNPFEIYVFHKDQNIIVFYDNMLNKRGELRLNDLYLNNISCISRSYDNNIWIVDLSQYKLLKINKKGDVLTESFLSNNELNHELNIYKIWESSRTLYIADSLVGIYKFDMYGTYSTTYHFGSNSSAIDIDNDLYLSQNNKLIKYNKLLRNPVELEFSILADNTISSFQNSIIIFYQNKIISYPTE